MGFDRHRVRIEEQLVNIVGIALTDASVHAFVTFAQGLFDLVLGARVEAQLQDVVLHPFAPKLR